MIDDKPGRRDDRRKLTKSAIGAVALELPDVNPNDLTAWDKAALDQIREIKRAAELEEYRVELKRVFDRHKPHKVMHLAAESHVDRSIDGPAAFVQTNMVGTYCLLEAARQYWMELDTASKAVKSFVFDGLAMAMTHWNNK